MKDRVNKLFGEVLADGKRLLPAVIIVVIYGVVTHLLFQEFCPLRILCGIPCPACGMTRAFGLLLQMRWREAWYMNPLIFIWMLWIGYILVKHYWVHHKSKIDEVILVFVGMLTIIVYLVQMIRLFPTREPYTYNSHNVLTIVLQLWQNLKTD